MTGTSEVRPMFYAGRPQLASDRGTLEVRNPANGELIGQIPHATASDVEAAVSAAQTAFQQWRRTEPAERAAALHAFADRIGEHAAELAMLDVLDNGSPLREMRNDIAAAAAQLRYFAGLVLHTRGETVPGSWNRLTYSIRQPFGVCVRIVPFNHPVMFAASKIAAPLAAGNTVIVKPSEHTSLSALRLGELAADVFPPGVVSFLTGLGRTTGDALVRHPDVRRVAVIGSATTGRAILRAANEERLTTVTLELGGKNPLVVLPDADLEQAVAAAQRGMNFTWQGQSCGSTSRILAHTDVYDQIVERLAAGVGSLRPGIPSDEATETGAIVNKAQYDKVRGYLELGRDEGARLVTGGSCLTDGVFSGGLFIQPTVFADVDPASRLAQEEIFGPVVAVSRIDDYDQAVRIANDVRYGLTASVFTRDLALAHRFARDVEAGYVWVNEVARHVPGTGFGGVKDSGLGREEDIDELLSYTQSKSVHLNFEA